jgi:hypothetical protein
MPCRPLAKASSPTWQSTLDRVSWGGVGIAGGAPIPPRDAGGGRTEGRILGVGEQLDYNAAVLRKRRSVVGVAPVIEDANAALAP